MAPHVSQKPRRISQRRGSVAARRLFADALEDRRMLHVLSTGSGDGSVTVTVDGFGSFGSAVFLDDFEGAIYDPIGPTPAASTTFQSGIAIRAGGTGQRQFLTSGNIPVTVDSFVKWRIVDVKQYYVSVQGDEQRAATRLKQTISDGLQVEFGQRTVHDVVSGQRDDIMEQVRKKADQDAAHLGFGPGPIRPDGTRGYIDPAPLPPPIPRTPSPSK